MRSGRGCRDMTPLPGATYLAARLKILTLVSREKDEHLSSESHTPLRSAMLLWKAGSEGDELLRGQAWLIAWPSR